MKSFVRCCQCENSARNEHSLSTRQTLTAVSQSVTVTEVNND